MLCAGYLCKTFSVCYNFTSPELALICRPAHHSELQLPLKFTNKSRKMAKRKSATSLGKVAKKSKVVSAEKSRLSKTEITTFGKEVCEYAKYNSLVPLLAELDKCYALLKEKEDEKVEEDARLVALTLFKGFQKILSIRSMEDAKDEKKQLVAKWLQDKYSKFKAVLCLLIGEKLSFALSLQLDALDIFLGLIQLESTTEFAVELYQELVEALILSENGQVLEDLSSDNFIILEFVEKFTKYWDLQVFFFEKSLAEKIESWQNLDSEKKDVIFSNYLTIIRNGLLYVADVEQLHESPLWVSGKLPKSAFKSSIKTRYQKCLLALMKIADLSASQYKALLLILHKRIIPFMGVPASLMDFLTDAYDQEEDEIVPILALNSLWELMKNYNLEYPDFYTKLYSLLTPSILYTRYRSRFFRLCDLFLSSTHLSANMIASFIKRLARLALTASAPGVVIVIPFVYNLLKRHPTCMILLQNSEAINSEYEDTFNNHETDPLKTGAMGSSLWELETLMSHYHPNVATLAKIFGEPFRKPSYNLEDFLDWSYLSLYDSEKNRKYKGLASLEYEEWDSLFENESSNKVYMAGWQL